MANVNTRISLGNKVHEIALDYAHRISHFSLIEEIRERRVPKIRYLTFIASMYPIVVGFNRALTLSMTKLDNVRDSAHLKGLSFQLQEEQDHNQLWRDMLDAHGINHALIYADLLGFLSRTEPERLTALTEEFLSFLRGGGDSSASTLFKDCPFPDSITALHHYMWMTGGLPWFHYLEHYASQLAMEVVIGYVVTNSIAPGVIARPDLSLEDRAIGWWEAHSLSGTDGIRTDEEKHIQLGVNALNTRGNSEQIESVLITTHNKLMLFEEAVRIQNDLAVCFELQRYCAVL